MPYAVAHVLATILLFKLIEKALNRKLVASMFLIGIAAMLPDIDIPLNWFLDIIDWDITILGHRMLTHTPFFALILVLPLAIFYFVPAFRAKLRIKNYTTIFLVFAIGILLHIALDFTLGDSIDDPGIMFLWPFSDGFIKSDLTSRLAIPNHSLPSLDALLVLVYLFYLDKKDRVF